MRKLPQSPDWSTWPEASRIHLSLKGNEKILKFWRLGGRRGIFSLIRNVSSGNAPQEIGLNQAVASYPTVAGRMLGLFERAVKLEKTVAECAGWDVVSDLDCTLCDRCGHPALVVVERPAPDGPCVMCRDCAARPC
jgi:hypothetical protein